MLYRVLIRVESLFCIAIEMDNKTPMSNAEEQENDQYSNSPEEYVEYDEREYERVADITVEIDKLVVATPEEIVRQAQGELCLINLCCPQIPLPEDSLTRLLPEIIANSFKQSVRIVNRCCRRAKSNAAFKRMKFLSKEEKIYLNL
jgi:hypothetical protein